MAFSKMKIPLFKINWENEDINAISNVVKRGSYWAVGPEIEIFEEVLAKYIGTKYAVVFNSGTSALHAILSSINIHKGDEIIVPSLSFISTSNAALFQGAKPVFADIEKNTYGLDAVDVKNKISKKTKAIIPVHYAGCPCFDIKKISQIAKDNNIFLIEDAAAALGAKIGKENVGTFGNAAMFSFCQNKIITTGEGGVIVTDSENLYKKLKQFVSHGKRMNDYISLGYNFRMPSMNAALGISQLKRVDRLICKRIEIANQYNHNLKDIDNIDLFLPPEGFHHVYWIYTIIIKNNLRDKLKYHLDKNGIFSKLYYNPIHLTTLYKKMFGYKKGFLPNTERFCDNSLSIPIFPDMNKDEIFFITDCIKQKMK